MGVGGRVVEDVLGAFGGEDVTGRIARRERRPTAPHGEVLEMLSLAAPPPEFDDLEVDAIRGRIPGSVRQFAATRIARA